MRAVPIASVRTVGTVVVVVLTVISCRGFGSLFGRGKGPNGPNVQGTPAVCIRADTPVHGVAGGQGETLASLALGETVYLSGERDSVAGGAALRVRLADGSTSGWVDGQAVVPNARAGALKRQVRIYRRPDSITVTEKRFQFMDMVALTDSSGRWAEVVGERRIHQGWIRGDALALNKQDVASAIFARKKLREMSGRGRKDVLDWIILNAPFTDSYFIEQLRNMSALEALFDTLEAESGMENEPTAATEMSF